MYVYLCISTVHLLILCLKYTRFTQGGNNRGGGRREKGGWGREPFVPPLSLLRGVGDQICIQGQAKVRSEGEGQVEGLLRPQVRSKGEM